MRIKPFQAIFPNVELITSADHFFSAVKADYAEYFKSGFFHKSSREGFYIYQITTPMRTFAGLIASVDIRDYLQGKIKKHENTIAAQEQQQMHYMLQRHAQLKPVILTYRKVEEIENLLKKSLSTARPVLKLFLDKNQEQHSFWEVTEGQIIRQIKDLFQEQVPLTYIADGHHRSSTTALMYRRYGRRKTEPRFNSLLAAFFPTDELEIHDFNRVIVGLNELTPAIFMAKISQLFDIELLKEARKPARKHEITMYLEREWYQLCWKKSILEEFKKEPVLLDVHLLNDKVLHGILGIRDVRRDIRLKYVEGPKGLEGVKEKTLKTENRLAFCLYPVTMSDFLSIADAGNVLPPKSTWFEPRFKNGLIVQEY